MKKQTLFCLLLLPALVCAQQPVKNKPAPGLNLNDSAIAVKPSLFNKANASSAFFFLCKTYQDTGLFFWDNNNVFLAKTQKKKIKSTSVTGKKADSLYYGKKLTWCKAIKGTAWVDSKTYRVEARYWYIIDPARDDCHAGPDQASVHLSADGLKTVDNQKNFYPGVFFLPDDKTIAAVEPESWQKQLTDSSGKKINVHLLDLNKDHVADLLWYYYEDEDSLHTWLWLYVNMDGKWTRKWKDVIYSCP